MQQWLMRKDQTKTLARKQGFSHAEESKRWAQHSQSAGLVMGFILVAEERTPDRPRIAQKHRP